MPEKLLTVKELSEYLGVSEDKIVALVDKRVLSAYKIGGELLRFRKEQIDAIRTEIESRIKKEDKIKPSKKKRKHWLHHKSSDEVLNDSFFSKVADFFYFHDFYLLSAVLIIALLIIIFRG